MDKMGSWAIECWEDQNLMTLCCQQYYLHQQTSLRSLDLENFRTRALKSKTFRSIIYRVPEDVSTGMIAVRDNFAGVIGRSWMTEHKLAQH
jgi:hypothetical protein